MVHVYILRCADNSLYIGHTQHLEIRIARHNDGRGCAFTATRRPVTLVYAQAFESRIAAVARERQIKRWTRRKKEALIAGDRKTLKSDCPLL